MSDLEQILNIIQSVANKTANGGTRVTRTGSDTRTGGDRVSVTPTYGPNHPTQTAAGQSILDILNGMGMDTGGIDKLLSLLSNISGLDAKDYQDQLYQMLLKQYLTAEQRNFDKSVLNEQRQYDLPINQLNRLVAAGIGRNAAIGMLSPTGDAGLIGSGVDAQLPTQVASPSEKAMQVAQTALDAIGVVGSLISLGFSAPAAIQQVKFLKNQNALTSSQLTAYDDASAAFGILNSAGASAEAFGSVANASAKITELANGGNQDAIDYVNSGRLNRLKSNSYFSSTALNNLYKSERDSSDYDKRFGLFVDNETADIERKKIETSKVAQEILNLEAEFKETIASTEFVESQNAMQNYHEDQLKAQTDLLRKQGKEIEANILESKARTNLLTSQTTSLNLDNQLTQGIYGEEVDGKTGLEWLTQGRAIELETDCLKFIDAKDKGVWKKELNYIASDYDRLYQLNMLRIAWDKGVLKKYNQDPQYQNLIHNCNAMQLVGAWDYIGMQLRAIDAQYGDNPVGQGFKSQDVRDLRKTFGIQ